MAHFPTTQCQQCGVYAPCMQVTFFQNIGLLVVRLTQTVRGMLCKKCIDAAFLRTSAISFFFGWWGVISFFVTLFTLPMNLVTWLRSLSLPAADPALQAQFAWAGAGASAPAFDGGLDGGGYAQGAPGSFATPVAAPMVSAPPKASTGSGVDILAIVAMILGVLALGATVLTSLVGIGMILDPLDDKSAESGMVCIVASSLVCGMPGLIGFAAGAYRLWAKQRAASQA